MPKLHNRIENAPKMSNAQKKYGEKKKSSTIIFFPIRA